MVYNPAVPEYWPVEEIHRDLRARQQSFTLALDSARFIEGNMNTTQISILMYGRDAHILETSRWALQSRGYRVLTTSHLDEFDSIPLTPSIDLVVLGHTLSPKESAEAFAHASSRWPRIKRLALGHDPFGPSTEVYSKKTERMNVPVRLISSVSEMVGYVASSSCSHIY
jgi:hypothetical protein